jgi:hypothetical protein
VSATFGALVAISVPIAFLHHTPASSWIRDAAPYGLFAAAPVIALDARRLPRDLLVGALVIGGVAASGSFAIEWIGRRGIAQLPIDRLVLPTGLLASALMAYAAARALVHRSMRWTLLCGIVLGLFLVTATRSTLLLFSVPVVIAIVARTGWRTTTAVLGGIAVSTFVVLTLALFLIAGPRSISNPTPTASPPVATASGGLGGPTAVPTETSRPDLVGQRIGSLGSILSNPEGDVSFGDRLIQTRAAWNVFVGSALMGTGPGYMIDWVSSSGTQKSTFTMDTPLVFVSKFGLPGIAAAFVLLAAFITSVRQIHRRMGLSLDLLTLVGMGLVFAIAALLNSPFEDKGVSFAAMLVLGMTLRTRSSPQSLRVRLPG